MENIFKPIKKDNHNEMEMDFAGVATATAWLEDKNEKKIVKDCNGNDIVKIAVSYLKDDNGDWKRFDKLIKSYISKLKNPVMLIKEYKNDFITTTTPDKIMKFAVVHGKKPSLCLGMSMNGSNVLKGISDDYYFYNSDIIRFMIFEDSMENEKKMMEII